MQSSIQRLAGPTVVFASMNLSPEQKRAILEGVDRSNTEQVFDAVATALVITGAAPQPVAWARADELDRLADSGINGRSCYLSKEQKERCTVPLYPAAPNSIEPAKELVLAAVRNALAGTRVAASVLEDIQFRSGMEAACEEIETRLSLAAGPSTSPQDKKN